MFDKIGEVIHNFIATLLWSITVGVFGFIQNILDSVFDPDADSDISPAGMITAHPGEWSDGNPWDMAQTLSENAIIPIAAIVLLVVLVVELVSVLTSGNQFENVGIQAIGKWFLKMIIGVVLLSNSFNIVSWVFTLGVTAGATGLGELADGFSFNLADISPTGAPPDGVELWALAIVALISLILFLAVIVLWLAIIITLAGRMIEALMYFSIAPIATATYMNQEWRSVGNGWLRGMLAVAFQAFFVVVALAIFVGLFETVCDGFDVAPNGAEDENGVVNQSLSLILKSLSLLAYTITLIFTIMRSGQISKTMFGAH